MSQYSNNLVHSTSNHPAAAFQALLAIGAMLATVAVVTSACLLSDDSSVRARIVVQGLEIVVLTWVAGFITSALDAIIDAHKAAANRIRTLLSSTSDQN